MNQATFGIVLIASLGMTLGSPLTCDKLKDVKEGADNYDHYLVKLKDSGKHKDAEYMINLVNQYQAILDQYASNVHEPSVKSRLELSENAGVLHGRLSQQALLLVSGYKIIQVYFMLKVYDLLQVCLESRVEVILPDYPRITIAPQGSDETKDTYTTNCSKLVLKEPYHGSNYSVAFKPKSSPDTLYYVIAKLELQKLNDDTLTFHYYYSIKKGNKMVMVVEMNNKALQMVSSNKLH